MLWANEFSEVLEALRSNTTLRERAITLICGQRMPGKATEGQGRVELARGILCDLVRGDINFKCAIARAENELAAEKSPHCDNNRVFCHQWAERFLRTQLSRFYNQAVIELLLENGEVEGLVPHSSGESADSQCAQLLAGGVHTLRLLLQRLVESYEQGHWSSDVKIPDHPHCTHVIRPLPRAESHLSSLEA
jgi:hypothetical protein